MVQFKPYESIENHYQQKYITNVEELYADIEFVATEKIHGANFSFIATATECEIAKRTSLLGSDLTFYNCGAVKSKYSSDIMQLFRTLQGLDQSISQIQVYGELFGGKYSGVSSVKGAKQVQKEVQYHPDNEFMVYDIFVSGEPEQNYYLSADEVERVCSGLPTLRCIPISHRGPLSVMIKLFPDFITKIPELFNLPPITNNFAEGWVIKPNIRHYSGIRGVIKIKSDLFKEGPTSVSVLSDTVNEHLSKLDLFLTENRFNNIKSKHGENTNKYKLHGLWVADALADYQKSLGSNLPDDLIQRLKKVMKNKAHQMLGAE